MSKDKIIVYSKSTCSKCREVEKLLNESGANYEKVYYYDSPISTKKLKELLKKMGKSAKDILRSNEQIYRDLKLKKKNLTDQELVRLIVKNPDLMQRPIVERGKRAVLGRPIEEVKSLL